MEFATSRVGERGGRRPIGVPWLPIHRVEESENVDTIRSAIQIVCTDCPEPLYCRNTKLLAIKDLDFSMFSASSVRRVV